MTILILVLIPTMYKGSVEDSYTSICVASMLDLINFMSSCLLLEKIANWLDSIFNELHHLYEINIHEYHSTILSLHFAISSYLNKTQGRLDEFHQVPRWTTKCSCN